MQTFANLVWREQRELWWPTLAALAIVTIGPLWCLVATPELAWFWVQMNLMVYMFAAGILYGMRIAAGERGQHSAALLATLPVPTWLLGVSKLLCTIAAMLLPILLLGLIGLGVRPIAERYSLAVGGNIWWLCGICAICTLHILLTVGVFGTGQKTELLAAGAGLSALAAWGVIAMGSSYRTGLEWGQSPSGAWENQAWQRLAFVLRYLGPPLEWIDANHVHKHHFNELFLSAVICCSTLIALSIAFLIRYHRNIQPLTESRDFRWPLPVWLPAKLDTPLAALWWKQLRETVPFALLVLVVSILVSIVFGLAVTDEEAGGPLARHRALTVLIIFAIATALGGFALSLLLGVSTFAADLEPRVNTFWRSRPISVHQWFWTKFAVGFTALVLTVGVPALAAGSLLRYFDEDTHTRLEGPLWILLFWFGMYSAAVLATCLVRNVLYAAVLAVGLLAVFAVAIAFVNEFYVRGTPAVQAASSLVAATLAILLAWQAATRDFALRTS